jgi:hypothetical protein
VKQAANTFICLGDITGSERVTEFNPVQDFAKVDGSLDAETKRVWVSDKVRRKSDFPHLRPRCVREVCKPGSIDRADPKIGVLNLINTVTKLEIMGISMEMKGYALISW